MTTAQINLAPKLIPVFQGKARVRGAHGGRGSSKTKGFATMMAVDGYKFGRAGISGMMLCAREHLNSLDESSLEEVKWAIRSVPWLNAYYDIGEKYIRSKDRRIKFAFTGLRHNIDAVKSKANILRAWVDEAEKVPEAAWRTFIPTIRAESAPGAMFPWQSELWLTWNPEFENSATNQRFRVNKPHNAKICELNWQDNPWFPDVLNEERLNDQRARPETYDHVWEGAYLEITDAQIFNGKFETDEFTVQPDWNGPYIGLDFGFAQDPTAAVELYIHDNVLYVRREANKTGLEIDATCAFICQNIPRAAMHVIRADNARPESISYLRHHGMPLIQPVKKGKGSVEDGLEYMKSFDRIIIHPDCPETAREFRLYSYKMDRLSGDILPIPIDAYNHHIDAIRYALEPMTKMRARPRVRFL